MYFHKAVALKNGNQCLLRNAEGTDAEEFLDYFIKAHGETDYLTTYPDETGDDLSKMSDRLASTSQSDHAIEIVAVIDGRIAGSAGISMINPRDKTKTPGGIWRFCAERLLGNGNRQRAHGGVHRLRQKSGIFTTGA